MKGSGVQGLYFHAYKIKKAKFDTSREHFDRNTHSNSDFNIQLLMIFVFCLQIIFYYICLQGVLFGLTKLLELRTKIETELVSMALCD